MGTNLNEKLVLDLYRKFCPEHYKKSMDMELELKRIKDMQALPMVKDSYTKVFDAINRDNVQILGAERNRNGEYQVVCRQMHDNMLWILLYSPTYIEVNNHPKIMARIEIDKEDSDSSYMYIQDILMVDDNVGNGSICMRHFLEETRKLGIPNIRGMLSYVDAGHFDRSIHFYEKHGFEVILNDDRQSGRIKYRFGKQ